MDQGATCTTCGHTGEDRRYLAYTSCRAGAQFVCDCCLEAYEMSHQPSLQIINTEEPARG